MMNNCMVQTIQHSGMQFEDLHDWIHHRILKSLCINNYKVRRHWVRLDIIVICSQGLFLGILYSAGNKNFYVRLFILAFPPKFCSSIVMGVLYHAPLFLVQFTVLLQTRFLLNCVFFSSVDGTHLAISLWFDTRWETDFYRNIGTVTFI